MKILNVNATLDLKTGGGTAERTYQISRHLADLGVDTIILTLDIGIIPKQQQKAKKVRIEVLPCLLRRYYIPIFSYNSIAQLVNEVDIVHIMGHWTFLNALVYLIAKNQKKPYIVCPAGALPIYGRSRLLKWIYNLVVGKSMIINADRHIAIAPTEIEQFEEYGVTPERVLLIPNGVNPEEFLFRSNAEFLKRINMKNSKFILYLGRLNHIKGPDLLLEAFCTIRSEYPEYKLLFVGPDAGMLASLKLLIKKCDAKKSVHFIEYLGGEEKSRVYHAAEFLVIPSRQEAMSIVVLEAGMCGTPVLLTDTCGFEQVANVGGGCVVSPSVKGIENGLRVMLKDSEELNNMGARLKKCIEDQFTWSITSQRYLAIYEEMQANA